MTDLFPHLKKSNPMPVILKPLTRCSHEEQMALYHARNHPKIRCWMLQDHELGVNEHLCWLASLENNTTYQGWAAFEEATFLGAINLQHIVEQQRVASIGIYLNPEQPRKGLGRVLLIWLLEHAFLDLHFRKLNAEMLAENDAAATLYHAMGFQPEGRRPGQVLHQDGTHDLLLFGLAKTAWQAADVAAQHANLLAEYALQYAPQQETPWNAVLKQIQHARAKNNINWMSLLKISLENATERSLEVIDEILRLDREISELAGKLVETARPDTPGTEEAS